MVSPQPFYPRFENMSVREVENIKVNNEEKEQNKTEKNGQNNEVFPMSSIGKKPACSHLYWYTNNRFLYKTCSKEITLVVAIKVVHVCCNYSYMLLQIISGGIQS